MELENTKKQKNAKREKHGSGGASYRSIERRLRQRERKHYTEDCMNDEEIDGKRMFSVEEKLLSGRFNANFVQEMNGEDLCIAYFQEHGFLYPIVIKEKSGLGMKLPNSNFTVHDVRQCVGSRRLLDVMDVTTQRDIEMTMREWVKYYENPHRDKLLNVISLEFSHTKLDSYIESPRLVREIDWVNRVWPQHLKDSQLESTNSIEDMRYPKVQKYCLMSVKGCYTDFHIDFGGTSVWYHILRGRKVFWLIPPTEMNVQLYEQWVLSGKQSDIFFGDTVDECGRIELEEGWTFFIPTGWIHAVYTPVDSLVFGGNFLHSFGIEKQLRIAQVEDATRVPPKFRYPFYTEMLWYVLDRYVHCFIGRSHVDWSGSDANGIGDQSVVVKTRHENGVHTNDVDEAPRPLSANCQTAPQPREPLWTDRSHAGAPNVCRSPDCSDSDGPLLVPLASPRESMTSSDLEGKENRWAMFSDWSLRNNSADDDEPDGRFILKRSPSPTMGISESAEGEHVHLTKREISGLKAIAIWLSHLSSSKRNVPDLIRDPVALLSDVKILLGRHRNDDPLLAITGKPVLTWDNLPKIVSPLLAHAAQEPKLTKATASVDTTVAPLVLKSVGMTTTPPTSKRSSSGSSSRRRRTRCKKCEACVRADCGDCHFCKDMKKFGGPGRMKQSCMARQCTAPILPHTACCMVCGKDGWRKSVDEDDDDEDDQFSTLMECSICWEIVHPECLDKPIANANGDGDEGLPNSWECPKCCRNTKGGPAPKLRQVKPGQKPGPKVGTRHGRETTQLENTPNAKSTSPTKRKEYSVFATAPWKRMKCESSDEDDSNSSSQSEADVTNKVKMTKARPSKSASRRRTSGTHVRSCVQQPTPLQTPLLLGSPLPPERNPVNFSMPLSLHAMDLSRPSTQPTTVMGDTRAETFDEADKMQKLKLRMLGLKSPPPPPPVVGLSEVEDKNGLLNSRTRIMKCDNEVTEPDVSPLVLTSQPLELANQQRGNSNMVIGSQKCGSRLPINIKKLKKPMFVVRPAPILDSKSNSHRQSLSSPQPHRSDFAMDKTTMLAIFRHLEPADLVRCMLVCRAWNAWCLDRNFWSTIELSEKKISTAHLAGIVRRQPAHLGLRSTNISKKLLGWLIVRLPQLRRLDLARCTWASSVSGLVTCNCPTLQALDVSAVDGLNDARVRELLAPPHDSRPGLLDSKSRLRNLADLRLSGCDVTDVALRYLTQYLPRLTRLDISGCEKVSDAGVALLTGAGSPVRESIVRLDAPGCVRLTDNSLEYLKRCPLLVRVDLRECPCVTVVACRRFIAHAQLPLMMAEAKLIEKQKMGFSHSS